MSKRCELQKEYYKQFGNYKGNGKYSDDYVKWLEEKTMRKSDEEVLTELLITVENLNSKLEALKDRTEAFINGQMILNDAIEECFRTIRDLKK